MGLNLSAVIGQAGLTVAQAIKEENKRIDLLTEKALDYHTQEYYKKKDKRSDKLEEVESLIGELASKFGDDRAIERAAFYVNQNGVAGTRALMNTYDDERARNNDLNATDFFKYVPSGKDIPLKTKLEYAEGIVKPIQMSQPEFLGGVQRDRGIASLFTADPSTVLQQGYETRKGMGLYDTETTRPELELGTGGADMSRVQGKVLSPQENLNKAEQELINFKSRTSGIPLANLSEDQSKELKRLEGNMTTAISRIEDRRYLNFRLNPGKTLNEQIANANIVISKSEQQGTDNKDNLDYLNAIAIKNNALANLEMMAEIQNKFKKGTLGVGVTRSTINSLDKNLEKDVLFSDKGGIKVYSDTGFANRLGIPLSKFRQMSEAEKDNAVNQAKEQNAITYFLSTDALDNASIDYLKSMAIRNNYTKLLDIIKNPNLAPKDTSKTPKDNKTKVKENKTKNKKQKVPLNKFTAKTVMERVMSDDTVPADQKTSKLIQLFTDRGYEPQEIEDVLKDLRKEQASVDNPAYTAEPKKTQEEINKIMQDGPRRDKQGLVPRSERFSALLKARRNQYGSKKSGLMGPRT
tara:strand:- start:3689 stop:5425 length:1737 start_codon:yes stop_codon:yes gene_type:complete